jgi:hypothetical protein
VFLRDVRSEFTDDVSGLPLSPIFTGRMNWESRNVSKPASHMILLNCTGEEKLPATGIMLSRISLRFLVRWLLIDFYCCE